MTVPAAAAAPATAPTPWRATLGAPVRWAKRRWDAPITQCMRLLLEACPGVTVALVAIIVLNAIVPAATIVATGLMIGSLPATAHAGLASAAGHRTLTLLGAWAALMMIGDLGPRLLMATATTAGSRVESRVQQRIIAALSRPWSIAHLEDPQTADLLSQVSGLGVGAVGPGMAISGMVTSRIPMILRSLVSGALLFAYSWPAALLLFAVQFVFVRQIRKSWVEDAKSILGKTDAVRRADYYRELALSGASAKEMRVLGLQGWLGERLSGEWTSRLAQDWKHRRKDALGGVAGAIAASLAGLVIYGMLAGDAARGVITLGALIIYLRSAQAIAGWGLSNADYAIEYGAASVPALRKLEAMTAAADPVAQQALAADAPAREIRFDNVSFAYAGGAPVLRGLSLAVPAGSSLAIVGLNGAGKTTLVKLLARLYDPTDGAIRIDGVDLREVDPDAWRERVAAIFQDFLRFGLSARDNVGFGGLRLAGDETALARAAEKAGVLARIRALPKGWDTPLMRQFTDGADLSGGEWQRVALARAFMAVEAGAKLLILDEPTAALDVRAEAELYERFLELTRGLTTILISHRFSTVRRADRICVIEHGAVAELGSHAELMALCGRYAELFLLQSQRFAETAAAL
jgi:ABC-type multidrug transport system fused ATPase/permease subunit